MTNRVAKLTDPVQDELSQGPCALCYVHWVWTTVKNVFLDTHRVVRLVSPTEVDRVKRKVDFNSIAVVGSK